MPTALRFPLQIRFNLETRNGVDSIGGASASIWRGNDLSVRVAAYSLDAPLDLSNVASLKLQIKDKQNPVSDALAEVEVLAAAITATITGAGFTAGTEQHATFIFTSAQTSLDLASGVSRSFWLVLSGLTTGGKAITYGAISFVIYEDNAGADGTPPVPPSSYYTTTEIDNLLAAQKSAFVGNYYAITTLAALAALPSGTVSVLQNGAVARLFFPGSIVADYRLRANTGAETQSAPWIILATNATLRLWELVVVSKQGVPCVWVSSLSKFKQVLESSGAVALADDADAFILP